VAGRFSIAMILALALAGCAPLASGQAFDASDSEQDGFVQGNVAFLAYHEAGHLILDQILNVDQHGDRLTSEIYADDIATWLMLPDADEPEQDEEILAAMEGWLQSAETGEVGAPTQSPHYPDDEARAERIACLVYGSNPVEYAVLRQLFPEAIAAMDCPAEVEAVHADFEAWFGEDLIPPAASGGAIQVRYEAAAAGMTEARDYLMESQILDDIAEDVSQFVSLPNEVSVVARSCGAGAAEFRYNPSTRQITACYEAVDWLMDHASAELAARPPRPDASAGASAEAGDDMGSGGARVTRRPRPRPR
jgi:Putative metallopeptidase